MSIRVGLYDFFAYTLPGIFYLLIVGFWLNAFHLVTFDINTPNPTASSLLSDYSLALSLGFIGAGYVIGLLVDPIAYRWFRLFRSRNSVAAKSAYDAFCQQHQWLNVKFAWNDWLILLLAVKNKSTEVAIDMEQHNVASIMLRNVSFGFMLISAGCLAFFFAISANGWNFVFAVASAALSWIAIIRSSIRRNWFYTGVFEAYLAHCLETGKLPTEYLLSARLADPKAAQAMETVQAVSDSDQDSPAKSVSG